MTHIEWFRTFLVEKERGTAHEICDYMIENNVYFNCTPSRRITSVSSQLNKECKDEKKGFIDRELNGNGVYVYFLKHK